MKRALLCLILVLLSPAGAGGEDIGWNVYMDASLTNRITCIGDSLWCATNGGILLFDLADSTFTQYMDGLGFRSGNVSCVTVDRTGSVWAGFATSGITRIDNIDSDPFTKHYGEAIEGLVSDSITCLVSVEDDVYYGSKSGVAKFNNNVHTWEIRLSDSLESKHVYDLLVTGDSLLWVACEDGVALFDRSKDSYRLFPIGRVTSLCAHEEYIYCAGDSGIQFYDGDAWLLSADSLYQMVPVSIASGGGELICITQERVCYWDGNYWRSMEASNMKSLLLDLYRIGWTRYPLRALAVDSRGNPWIGGELPGEGRGPYILYHDDGGWKNEAPDLLSHNTVVEVDLDPSGGLWISTRKYGISYISSDERWTSYRHMDDLSYYKINLSLIFDSQGYLWCNAPYYDVDRIKVNDPFDKGDDQWAHFTLGEGTITTKAFFKAKEDPGGNRWFLADDQEAAINIASADGTEWLSIGPSEEGLAVGKVFDCAFGNYGKVYLALPGYGVQIWHTRGFDWTDLKNSVTDYWETIIETSKDLWAIATNDTLVWVGASGGILRYERQTARLDSITQKTGFGEKGLISGTVNDVEFDGEGKLWVATSGGLERISSDGDILETYTSAAYWRDELQGRYYESVISPLPSHICNALQYDEVNNVLWVGTEYGVSRLDLSPPVVKEIPLSKMILYPNPLHISRRDESLKIWGISEPVSVQVYNIEGELVHEVDGVSEGGDVWDLLTLNGYQARSGIYIVRVSNSSGFELRKVAVVR